MMQKRTLYSLLLISFILVSTFSLATAQTVTFEGKTVARCEATVLNVTVDNPTDVSAIEVIFEVSSLSGGGFFDALNVNWDPGFGVLTNRIVDISGVNNVSPDTIRIAAMFTEAGDACLAADPANVIAQVVFTTNDVCDGEVVLAGAVFSCPSFDVETQFVDCATTSLVPAQVVPGTVTIQNNAPTFDNNPIANAIIHWGDLFTETAVAEDADLQYDCEALEYYLINGPDGLTVGLTSGAIEWQTDGEDVCLHNVDIQVVDACDAADTVSFTICVENTPPEITCPVDTTIALGDNLSAFATATDDDTGPFALAYSLLSFSGPGTAMVDPVSGEFTWQTLLDPTYKGVWTAEVVVSDGANICEGCSPSNSDTCSFTVTVINFLITIEKTHNTPQGQIETVDVFMQDSWFENYPMGGFDFLIQYDASALSLQTVDPGAFLDSCGWEYFTYRQGYNGNCGGNACPSGFVRIVAIAETNNGPGNHPDCFTNTDPTHPNQLAVLHFLVTNDRTFNCQYAPVNFYWYDCGDNAISSVDGEQLFISNNVYSFEDTLGDYYVDLTEGNYMHEMPHAWGANYLCDVALEDGKPDPLRFIDFVNGGIDIVCSDSIDAPGDINLNEIPNEIGDAVVFSNYFIYGLSAFNVHEPGQIAATDVNQDGLTLSVADLVYLIRIIVGDAQPYSKVVTPVAANYVHTDAGSVAIRDDIQIGAAFVVAEGDVVPDLKASDMEMLYNFDGNNTRILVYSLTGNSFTGEFLNLNSSIVSIEMADFEGSPIVAKELPSNFALKQNYPNPFNPTTTIAFSLPTAENVELNIYNINGQKVTSFADFYEAGAYEITFDASTMASGVYFYRIQAGSFTDQKKMVLIK